MHGVRKHVLRCPHEGRPVGGKTLKAEELPKKKCMRSMLKTSTNLVDVFCVYIYAVFRLRLRSLFIFRFWFRLLRAYMISDRYQQEEVKVYRHQGSLLGAEAKWSIESDLVLPPPTMITFIYSSVYSF